MRASSRALSRALFAVVVAAAGCAEDEADGGSPDATLVMSGRLVRLEVRPLASELAQREPAVRVSACLPGGAGGATYAYAEHVGDVRERVTSYAVESAVADAIEAADLEVDLSPLTSSDASAPASSAASIGVVRAVVPAGQHGMWFRQAARIDRVGELIGHSAAGDEVRVGRVTLHDWTWTVGLELDPTCSTGAGEASRS